MRQQHGAGEKVCGSMGVQAGAEASPKLACGGPSAQTSRGQGRAQRRKSLSSSCLAFADCDGLFIRLQV